MKFVDLKISPDLKQWLLQAAEENSESSIVLIKSTDADDVKYSWGVSVATPETIELCGIDKTNIAEVDGLECIVSHPESIEELSGKYLCWNEQGMWLESNT